MPDITDKRQQHMAQKLREVLATYRETEDLINIGAYERGSNSRIDYALAMIDRVREFLRQEIEESFSWEETQALLFQLFEGEE